MGTVSGFEPFSHGHGLWFLAVFTVVEHMLLEQVFALGPLAEYAVMLIAHM
jgi:hypothetical protein